ncbi:MAG: cation diffusion facilitator family transporter [Planctomycetota bacterium]
MTKQNAALLSIFSNTALIVFKIIAGVMMNSVSVISEAIHSGIDLIASIVAFFSIKKASVPADKEHAYGHGKFENVSGFFEATLIFMAAGLIIYEAVRKFLHGVEIQSLEAGIAVMFISALINIIISRQLFKTSKKTGSIALEADAWHLLTDVYTSAGVMLGLVLIKLTGIVILDPVVAVLVALMIIKASVDLTIKSVHDLLDRSLPEEETNMIIKIITAYPQVASYHKLRTRKSGNRREIDIHLRVNKDTPLTEAHQLCHNIEQDVKKTMVESYIVIHIEPQRENNGDI